MWKHLVQAGDSRRRQRGHACYYYYAWRSRTRTPPTETSRCSDSPQCCLYIVFTRSIREILRKIPEHWRWPKRWRLHPLVYVVSAGRPRPQMCPIASRRGSTRSGSNRKSPSWQISGRTHLSNLPGTNIHKSAFFKTFSLSAWTHSLLE